ncbi:hypothetical protein Vretifemale_4693 [Volvox reticuliferus]|uniref:GPI-anchored surface protein n=1 Tax=Volvox reticuliferus TaxID=1737510 RepID=A0A8J4C3F9_9CHLO|nr:hypothetical protein Vretifemale_4693 [Volvox reticuliferus]
MIRTMFATALAALVVLALLVAHVNPATPFNALATARIGLPPRRRPTKDGEATPSLHRTIRMLNDGNYRFANSTRRLLLQQKQQQQQRRRRRQRAVRSPAMLLAAYPHIFPSCQALLYILEQTQEGRLASKDVLAPMQRLQYLQRTLQQYKLDLETLFQQPGDRRWEPYLAAGLQRHPRVETQDRKAATAGNKDNAVTEQRPSTAAIEDRAGTSAQEEPLLEATKASGDDALNPAAAAAAAAASQPMLSIRERVLRSTSEPELLQMELETRLRTLDTELLLLKPAVEQRLEHLRALLRAAVEVADVSSARQSQGNRRVNSTYADAIADEEGTSRPPGDATGTTTRADVTVDPDDLELYELLLAPCLMARLQPRNYVSYPPRPRVSVLLSYSGRKLPYVTAHIVEPLLACTAGKAASVTTTGTTATAGTETSPQALDLELLVAFDDSEEAAGWAAIAEESGGRVIPVFRPGGPPGCAGSSNEDCTGRDSLEPQTVAVALHRLSDMAQGEVLVVLNGFTTLACEWSCSWLELALRAVDAWPRLAALGSGGLAMDELHKRQPPTSPASKGNGGLHFWDSVNRLPLQFTAIVTDNGSNSSTENVRSTEGDICCRGILAFRRAAWQQVGGVDADLGAAALYGSGCAWQDLSTRLWLAGWEVALMPASAVSSAAKMSSTNMAAAMHLDLDRDPRLNHEIELDSSRCSRDGPGMVKTQQHEAACLRALHRRYCKDQDGPKRMRKASTDIPPPPCSDGVPAADHEIGFESTSLSWLACSELRQQITRRVQQLNELYLQPLHRETLPMHGMS